MATHQGHQVIPAQAVEAAAKEAFFVDDLGGHIKGRWTWDTIPEGGRENYRKLARAILNAATPLVAAEALERAALDAYKTPTIAGWLRRRAAEYKVGNGK